MIASRALGIFLLAASLASITAAEARRVVVIKLDGLSDDVIERNLHSRNAAGVSSIPWIEEIFVKHGARLRSFYVRGLSLSVPSWSLLDTGHHLEIHGNVEFDRYTSKAYDYLNFFPFYVNYALSRNVDMPTVEVLDDASIPLLLDVFPFTKRYQGFQLFQRAVRWRTLQQGLKNRFASRSVRDLLDEWQTGFQMSTAVTEQLERELIEKLSDPNIRYLDYFSGDIDHMAHLTNSIPAQDRALQQVDTLVGRVWAAVQASPARNETIFVLVSDHGINSDPTTYSQGYSLLDLFRRAEGGAHHVITNRYPLSEYKIRGLDPFVSKVTTASDESFYLQGKAEQYPTALLDLDGNERASIALRNNSLNIIHLLLREIQREGLDAAIKQAAASEVIRIIDAHRSEWTATAAELAKHIDELNRRLDGFNAKQKLKAQPKWTQAERTAGLDQQYRREVAAQNRLVVYQSGYAEYRKTLLNLLSLDEPKLLAGRYDIADLVEERAMGDNNNIHDLENYTVGLAPGGLKLTASGTVDPASFRTLDYFSLLSGLRVRNNVQPGVSAAPVDFIAIRISPTAIREPGLTGAIWLYSDENRQALVLSRGDEIRYEPVRALRQDARGTITYEPAPWAAGLPLKLFEDFSLEAPGDRAEWLSAWHPEREWFQAVHKTVYSNGIIGITEALAPLPRGGSNELNEFIRDRVRSDFVVFANDHWNFNVRNFNPGGNHGSFLRISTHSALMFAGAGVPQGLEITAPYDSLAFVPTVLHLLHESPKGAPLPGRPIAELIPEQPQASR